MKPRYASLVASTLRCNSRSLVTKSFSTSLAETRSSAINFSLVVILISCVLRLIIPCPSSWTVELRLVDVSLAFDPLTVRYYEHPPASRRGSSRLSLEKLVSCASAFQIFFQCLLCTSPHGAKPPLRR